MNVGVERITMTFGRTIALDEIDVSVDAGVTGVFGPNGSGKSTLLRVIAGILKPAQGAIVFDGRRLARLDEEHRRRIGYAGHESGLYGRLSLSENLRLFATLYGTPQSRVDDAIDQLNLADLASRPVRELSAGSKRRAAVARALLHDPDLLLLDEPYANVDDEAAATISSAIEGWKVPGKTALVATHGAKKVRSYADGVIVLQRGRLVRTGRYTEAGFAAT